ncbi:hypothetical protein SB2_28035 [Methylobacterium radiotolerans]|nr:hypothetical protein SB3_29520 [Methylobacterium radiotolerans]KTS43408.1 hypothetical protein SB2_28035 [Methylobacterium radiotolerans]
MVLAKPSVNLSPAENAARISAAIVATDANTAEIARETAGRLASASAEAGARISGDNALAQQIAATTNNAAAALRQEVAVREAAEAGVLADTQRALDVASTRVDALATMTRPGDSPDAFSPSLAGGAASSLPALPGTATANSDRGFAARLYGSDIVAARRAVAIEPGRTYRIRAVVQRRSNAVDPTNDTVRVAIQWLNGALQPIAGGFTVARDIIDMTTASGRLVISATVALFAAVGVDYTAAPGTVYGRPYVQTFGGQQVTDVEVIELHDITDALAYAPDVSQFDARLQAQESLNAGSRLTTLEQEVAHPKSLTFRTVSDAEAATVPAEIEILDVLGYAVPGVGRQTYRRSTATSAAPGLIQTADGSWWGIIAVTMTGPMFGADPTGGSDSAGPLAQAHAALPVGQPLVIPPGTYALGSDVDMTGRLVDVSGASLTGPGKIQNALFARSLPTGVMAYGSNRGEAWQGIQIGGGNPEDGSDGIVNRLEGHATWQCMVPSRDLSSMEFSLHNSAATGEAVAQAGTSKLVWTGRGRQPSAAWVGRRLWFNYDVFRVAGVAGNTISLTRSDGSSFTFGATVTEVFFLVYVYGRGTCKVSGNTVSRIEGDPFVLYYDNPSFEFRIDGITRKVVGNPNTFHYQLDAAPGDREEAVYEFFFDINNGQITTFRLHRTDIDAENLSLYVRPDGAWIQSQYGGYGRYRPIRLTTGELVYSPGSAIQQIVIRPEALILGGDYGWDAMRILMPQAQPANYMQTEAGLPGQPVGFAARGTDADVGFYLDVKGRAAIALSSNNFAEVVAKFIPQPGATHYPQFLNAGPGSRVTLSAASDTDTQAGLLLAGMGGGGVMIEPAGDGAVSFFGTAPAAKQPAPDILTTGVSQLADVVEAVNQLRSSLFTYGLIG